MRLYDRLLEEPGGENDTVMLGGVTRFCELLKTAQCFQLSEDISFACGDVCRTRPSTMLGALDLIRAPYPRTWVEWTPSHREGNRDNHHFLGLEKPMPKRVGALINTDPTCTQGYIFLAWEHKDGTVMVCPFGLIFDWDSRDTEPVISQYLNGMYGEYPWIKKVVEGRLRNKPGIPDRWKSYSNDPKEREASDRLFLRGDIVPMEIFMNFIATYKVFPGSKWYDSFCDDLAGELPFVEAFLLLLNSKNSIIRQERDDFTKLNKARSKNRKPPLKEFINTKLRISKIVGNRLRAAGVSREEARLHVVRGHFKIRKSGVYWWSPHPRGNRHGFAHRHSYEVRT